ncbi:MULTISPECIES: hypothetical protein [Desulfosediminicola]|uniref:hypothetical protein n=1 Tax=Desulfosediminicola TaxID=2886823 RepID=UPI0010ABC76C|nr:hypothetical protein [Desulfosediminicola ganghwensis]
MTAFFDLANIAAGVILAIEVLRDIQGVGWRLQKLECWLREYQQYIGWACLGFGAFFLLLKPGYVVHDLVGVCAGLLLLKSKVLVIPGIGGYLEKAAEKLNSLEVAVGIAAIVVGLFGLLKIPIFA